MIALGIATLSLLIWIVLALGRDGFWLTRERDGLLPPLPGREGLGVGRPKAGVALSTGQPTPNPSLPGRGEEWWPSVVAVVPARDEAEVIAESIASLAAQDYPGDFRIILVDDSSSDGTADIARAVGGDRLQIVTGAPLVPGWTGKLWAVSQGVAAAGDAPDYLLLTDADIAHAPDSVRSLVARAVDDDRVLVSLMARLRCESLAERALIPAFVWFFQMLYPFATVNRRGRGLGAAAGGVMLVQRRALAAAGGIVAVRSALIDDCAFGALMK
ncbi:MAG: glycosyltransferase, partial [Sphingomonas sp.]